MQINEEPFFQTLLEDSTRENLKVLWGESVNFEKKEKKNIIEVNLAKKLCELFKVAPYNEQNSVMHAGLQHTYGYLLSDLQTKFGPKKDRWTKNQIETGLLFPSHFLSPNPKVGTLFLNVTFVFSKLIQKNTALENQYPEIKKALKEVPFEKMSYTLLREIFEKGELKTYFIPYLNGDGALVIYTLTKNSQSEKLITGFPVTLSVKEKIFDEKNLGENKIITPRYNVFLEEKEFIGQRFLSA